MQRILSYVLVVLVLIGFGGQIATPAASTAPRENEIQAQKLISNVYISQPRSGSFLDFGPYRSESDTRGIKSKAEYLKELQQFRQFICLPAPVVKQPVGFDAAVSTLRALVVAQSSQATVDTFRSALAGRSAAARSAIGTALMGSGKGQAALIAYLDAFEANRANPAPLVSAAAIATLFEKPNEALALLDRADQLSAGRASKDRALAFNNRGHALQQLSDSAGAEVALRQAITIEPLLAEARLNLAQSLLCQNKDDEAVTTLIAGLRRKLAPKDIVVSETPPTTREQADEALDLRLGLDPELPVFSLPNNYVQIPSALVKLRQQYQAMQASSNALATRGVAIVNQEMPAQKRGINSTSRLTRQRTVNILDMQSRITEEPSIKPLWDALNTINQQSPAFAEILDIRLQTEAHPEYSKGKTDPERLALFRAACTAVIADEFPRWRNHIQQWDQAKRNLLTAAYRHLTGLAANLADPLSYELAMGYARQEIDDTFLWLFDNQILEFLEQADNADTAYTNSTTTQCWQDSQPAVEPKPSSLRQPQSCPPALSGMAKATLTVAEVFTIAFNCEQIELEAALLPEGVTPFGQVIYKKGGEWTIFGGVKGELPATPLGTKLGFFIRGDSDGNLTDGGIKTSSSGVIGAVEVEPIDFEGGVVSAYEYYILGLYR